MRFPLLHRRWFGLLLLGLVLITGACGNTGNASESTGQPQESSPQGQDAPTPVSFEIADINTQQLEELQEQPAGAYWVTVDDKTYLVVTAGQKPTAGFTVHIEAVTFDGTALNIRAQLQEPKPGDMVAQVITFPMVALSILDESLHHAPATVEWTSAPSNPAS